MYLKLLTKSAHNISHHHHLWTLLEQYDEDDYDDEDDELAEILLGYDCEFIRKDDADSGMIEPFYLPAEFVYDSGSDSP